MISLLHASLLLTSALALAACQRATPPGPAAEKVTTFDSAGVVRKVDIERRRAVIAHEAIPGYMEAMTMEFDVPDAAELGALAPGDAIAFRLSVTDAHGWIDRVRKTGRAPVPEPTASAAATPAMLPEATLVDEHGQAFRLADFRGRALALTFIYTRCPYPDFCPLMSNQFGAVQRELAGDGAQNWSLVSITIDPTHDTPEVLAAYAARYQPDAAHWKFATGEAAEIRRLGTAFGLSIVGDGAKLEHNLRTVVVDPSGRVQRVFNGNEWKPAELAAELRRAMTSP